MESIRVGKYHRWQIISENIAIKTTDKSFFKHRGSAIPKQILGFWEIGSLSRGERRDIQINYKGINYDAHFIIETSETKRARLFWSGQLSQILKEKHPLYENYSNDNFPYALFHKIDQKHYSLRFLEGKLRQLGLYTHNDVYKIFGQQTSKMGQSNTLVSQEILKISESNDYVIFINDINKAHFNIQDAGISIDGIFTWVSPNKESLQSATIQDFIHQSDLNNKIYLFIKPNENVLHYVYLGNLEFITHDTDRECPVHIKWRILEFDKRKTDEIMRLKYWNDNIPNVMNSEVVPLNHLEVTKYTPKKRQSYSGARTDIFKSTHIDFEEEQKKRTKLGCAGEDLAYKYEVDFLKSEGYPELAEKVQLTRKTIGNNAPYDILSFDPKSGLEKYIEVKTTTGSAGSSFYISKRELEFSNEYANSYYLYRIYEYNGALKSGKMYIKEGAISKWYDLKPESFKCQLK